LGIPTIHYYMNSNEETYCKDTTYDKQ